MHEQALTSGAKLLAAVLTLFIMGGWLSGEILRYADDIFQLFLYDTLIGRGWGKTRREEKG